MARAESDCHKAAQLSSSRGSRMKTVKALLFISFAAPGFPDSFSPAQGSALQAASDIRPPEEEPCPAGELRSSARSTSVHSAALEVSGRLQSQRDPRSGR